MKSNELVSIKGTKQGIILNLDDNESFEAVFKQLQNFMYENHLNMKNNNVPIFVKLGYRYLKDIEKEKLSTLLEKEYKLHIENFDSELVLKEQVFNLYNQTQVKTFSRVVRSGQVLSVEGTLLLIGDVNPGGKVEATGNIIVVGELLGMAHAGVKENNKAIIAASFMNPTQLRIGTYISRSPDYETEGVFLECGFVDETEKKIRLDKIKTFPRIEKELNVFERSLLDG